MALWDLSAPIFFGTFLALVAVIVLMGKAHKLLRGPKALLAWIDHGDRRHHRCQRGRVSHGSSSGWKASGKHAGGTAHATHAGCGAGTPATRKAMMTRQWKVGKKWSTAATKASSGPATTMKVVAVPTPGPEAAATMSSFMNAVGASSLAP